ncbi:ArsR/SmtB family transcription factor [Streptosporangium amethystogenes]|uniref:ArsR/SmtB family transcription factor n=1 Tax=Streptosporangium amethystogenes TaxID=2002 RepID=UPI0004C64D52|nr:winged helix-turn-helix domain-containing protein [Streptosporangium amethystogenes]
MRLHFAPTDLQRITFAPAPNQLLESVLSVRGMRVTPTAGKRPRPGVREWQRRMNGSLVARAGMLPDLVGTRAFLPDFLLQPTAPDFASAVELARQTPEAQLVADLEGLPPSRSTERWRLELSAGAAGTWCRLTSDLRDYFSSSLEPLWPRIRAAGAADRALRAETLLRGGTDALLTTLGTNWYWRPPVLHVPASRSYDVKLCGRGLLLVPSYFAPGPLLMYRPDRSTVLVYPVCEEDAPAGAADTLGPLLGRTRAEVLATLRDPATTTVVAERAGVSLASASQHTTVLRNAGLISTTRMGGSVLHTLTPLGAALLQGDAAAR